MGNTSSKAARKLPTRTPPAWAGARTAPKDSGATAATPQVHRASEQRTPGKSRLDVYVIRQEMLKVTELGPVKVDHGPGAQNKRQEDPQITRTNRLFQSRAQSEEEASSFKPARNHLFAGSLHDLLTARKSAKSQQDIKNLADRYHIDVEKLESLARFLNSPSVGANSSTKSVDKSGEETIVFTAVWAEPKLHA